MADKKKTQSKDEPELVTEGQSNVSNNPWQNIPNFGVGGRIRKRSLGGKFFLLGILATLLCIPLFMVWGLVQEREYNYRKVVAEIGRQWGADQTIMGPLIGVPVTIEWIERQQDRDVLRQQTREVLISPDTIEVDSNVDTMRRTRGIHEAIVYQSSAAVSATFKTPDMASFSDQIVRTDWSRARILMSVSDLKGIGEIAVHQNGKATGEVEPGFGGAGAGTGQSGYNAQSGLHVPVDLSSSFGARDQAGSRPTELRFDIELSFKGSQTLSFVPVGSATKVKIQSIWPHPSFSGEFLPISHEISEAGFTAQWSVSKLARSIPQVAFAGNNGLSQFMVAPFGVRFYQPVDFYRLVDRAVKYGVLFVGMAFLVIFAIEVMSKGRMHTVHYTMAGMMVIMFYVLLLAIAEMVGFTLAFAIAAGATGAVLAGFVASIFKGRRATLLAFGGFTGLYGLLYLVLRLEDAALLAGAVTGFVILTAMMFATRNVDWAESNRDAELSAT